jgi:hypothetical protein
VTDDEHAEEDEFPNMFGNSDEEDPWKGSVLGRQVANQVEKIIRARQTAVLRAVIRDLKSPTDAEPTRHFSKEDLDRYVAHRKSGLADKSLDWISRSAEALWDCPRIERAFLESEKQALGNFYEAEYRAEWISAESCFFDRDEIQAAFSNDIEPLL